MAMRFDTAMSWTVSAAKDEIRRTASEDGFIADFRDAVSEIGRVINRGGVIPIGKRAWA